MNKATTLTVVLAVAGLAVGVPAAAATRAGTSLAITDPVADDLYAAAGTVLLATAVDGDAVLAGGTVTVAGDIASDALLAGGSVDVAGVVGDDLRAAGGQVTISGLVTDQAIIAGSTVTLTPDGAVAGRMWIAGNDVDVAGQVGGNLRVTAATVRIGGRIEGDVDIRARRIEIEPGATIGGDFTWRSDAEPVIAEDAQILGNIGGARPAFDDERGLRAGRGLGGRLALALAVFIAAAVLWRLFPEFVRRGSGKLRAAPLQTLVAGAAAFALTPLVVLLLFLTAIGWLLALVLAAGYGFALAGTGLLALAAIAEAFASRGGGAAGWPRRLLLLAVIVTGVVLLQGVPGVGGVVTILLWLAGLGMAVRVLRDPPMAADRDALPSAPF